ncbi:hypothetical protein HDU79_005318 [Rhizoclosmatium sp. JEL0117]|nr:hypothetical protein HDU79_005318 [Rhizoclosmatium sp. JEL0117]
MTVPKMDYDKLLLLGDSLTEWSIRTNGWGQLLMQEYSRRLDVEFHGYGGYNSWHLMHMLPSILQEFQYSRDTIKLVTLLIGTNDARSLEPQHVDVDEYQAHLEEIIHLISETVPKAKLVVMTPPPVGQRIVSHFHFKELIVYRDACIETVQKLQQSLPNLELLNLWDLLIPTKSSLRDPAFDPASIMEFFSDGIHFSDKGNKQVFDGILTLVKEKWPDLTPATLKFKYPSIRQIPFGKVSADAVRKALFVNANQGSSLQQTTATSIEPNMALDKIILLGDSLTDYGIRTVGWGQLLSSNYTRKLSIKFRGFGGYTAFHMNQIIQPVLNEFPVEQTKLVALMIGTNDYYIMKEGGIVSGVGDYKLNLEGVIRTVVETVPGVELLVMTPPPIGGRKIDGYLIENARVYRDACIQVVETLMKKWSNIELINLWNVFVPAGGYDSDAFDPSSIAGFFLDGIHFGDKGHKAVFDSIIQRIESKWPQWKADQVEMKFPRYNELPGVKSGEEELRKVLFRNEREDNKIKS